MQKHLYVLFSGLALLCTLSAFGQRQELSVSPVGLLYPRNQMVHYERYLNSWRSWTVSLSHNSSREGHAVVMPPGYDRLAVTRGAIGFRQYFDIVDGHDEFICFGSVRAVVDYSDLRLKSRPQFGIPADSLQAGGFSLAPELLLGGKLTVAKRITLSGAVGAQYFVKTVKTGQITRNQAYWNNEYWTNDQQEWQYKRNVVVNFRRGWYPSVQLMVGVLLGKQPQSPIVR